MADPTASMSRPPAPLSRGLASLLLGSLLLVLCVVTGVWVSIDRRPPAWDHANHLERAYSCYRILSEPGHDRFREIVEATAFYPPVVTCATGLLYFLFPAVPSTAQAVMMAYLAVALWRCSPWARGPGAPRGTAGRVLPRDGAVRRLLADQLPARSAAHGHGGGGPSTRSYGPSISPARAGARRTGASAVSGCARSNHSPPHVLPPLLWAAWPALRAPDRLQRLARPALAIAIGGAAAISWYRPRLLGLPMQISARSFKQAAEFGYPDVLSVEGLLCYPRVLQPQFGILAGLLFVSEAHAVLATHRPVNGDLTFGPVTG